MRPHLTEQEQTQWREELLGCTAGNYSDSQVHHWVGAGLGLSQWVVRNRATTATMESARRLMLAMGVRSSAVAGRHADLPARGSLAMRSNGEVVSLRSRDNKSAQLDITPILCSN